MENKKQLVIIPPMSEALRKLNEVLDGIANDENIEISIIDDLKELSQFLATTGQCLILVSNAKKCATFLQDNKATLLKHHCKTILFTPKEIPAKTLIKFTKVGLTESILESAPPKTFLYKVKLLLRSIKTITQTEEKGREVIKSSLDNANQPKAEEKVITQTNDGEASEENAEEISYKKKRQEGEENTIDYGANLKGKVKPQEESIDTHWKSNRKKDEVQLEESEEEKELEDKIVDNNIDMYYRNKKVNIEMELEEAPAQLKKKNDDDDFVEDAPKKKKSNDLEEIEELLRQKKLSNDLPEEDDGYGVLGDDNVSLDLIPAENKKKKREEEYTEEEQPLAKSASLDLVSGEEEKKRKNQEDAVDLGGHYKGKITKQEELEADEEIALEKPKYDNTELTSKEKSLDLIFEEAAEALAKKRANEEYVESKDPHEGEVDKIDTNLFGDAGTVDKIKTRMEGRFQKEDKSLPSEEETSDAESDYGDLYDNETKDLAKKEKDKHDDEDTAPKLERNSISLDEEEEEKELTKDTKLKLLDGKDNKKGTSEEEYPEDKEKELKKSSNLDLIDGDLSHKAKNKTEEEEDQGLKKLDKIEAIGDKKSKEKNHNAAVDKIDTYYRGGESKKTNHSWDNLVDKNNDLDLGLIPGAKKSAGTLGKGENKDLGEITIDYKKLKEEFDAISKGEAIQSTSITQKNANGELINDEDEGSFKVIEIDPRSIDLAIRIQNSIFQKDIKDKSMYVMIAEELMNNYKCQCVFYNYKTSENKYTEVYNSYVDAPDTLVTIAQKEWWNDYKKDTTLLQNFQSKSMTTWRCPEISNNGEIWEDVELPSWAENELKNKFVELIFPYFDGLDKMGMALVFFPEGINPAQHQSILMTLELGRTLYLDKIERYQVKTIDPRLNEVAQNSDDTDVQKKNVLGFISGLFGRKKTG